MLLCPCIPKTGWSKSSKVIRHQWYDLNKSGLWRTSIQTYTPRESVSYAQTKDKVNKPMPLYTKQCTATMHVCYCFAWCSNLEGIFESTVVHVIGDSNRNCLYETTGIDHEQQISYYLFVWTNAYLVPYSFYAPYTYTKTDQRLR